MMLAEQVDTNRAIDNAPFTEGSEVRYCKHCGEAMIGAPVIQCPDCGAQHRVRCYVRRLHANCYLAECIDLDISAEGQSREAAIAGLQDAMIGYMQVMFEGQETDAQVDVFRLSPLSHRIRYYVERLKDIIAALLSRHPLGKHVRTFDKNLDCCSHC